MRLVPPLSLLILLCAAPGCAVRSTAHVVRAEQALRRAAERGAEADAVYEYTLAERYLEKAREQAAHARHASAAELARAAEEYADQAVITMQQRGLGESQGSAAAPVTDVPAEAPPAEEPPEEPLEEPADEAPQLEPVPVVPEPATPAPTPESLWEGLEPPPPDLDP